MRAREEAAAYAGRAWLEMSRRDRRRAVRLMRRIRANKAARQLRPGCKGPSTFLQSAHWRLLLKFFDLIEKNERRLYTSREARETAEKCAYIYHTQANKKGKPE